MIFNELGFKFAFTIEGFSTREVLDDPAYVKYNLRFVKQTNGEWSEKLLTFHKCNETDWNDFAPASKGSKGRFEDIRDMPNRGFFCIDWPEDEPPLIYGGYTSDSFQYVEINLVPC